MKDIDEQLDEQIKDILNFLDEKSHQSLGYNTAVQAIKQLINQARIDEVENIVTDVIANDNYHEHNDSVGLYMKKKYQDRLKELKGE